MTRKTARWLATMTAGLALAGTANAADNDNVKKRPALRHSFYSRFLAPEMASGLNGQAAAAAFFANPNANPWTQDNRTVSRVEQGAISAVTRAVKQYAIESLGIDTWSLPLAGARGSGVDKLKTESGGTRLRFGVAQLAPRAEVLVPAEHGRLVITADARGRVGTSFESSTARFRVGVSYDAAQHTGSFSLLRRF